jgi:guanylate kinase
MANKRKKQPGLITVISSASGTGKTTICHSLIKKYSDFKFSISATTRPARGREKNGVDYHFINDKQFDKMILKNQFAEWADVFSHRYGTPISETENALKNDLVLMCDIDVQGGMQIKEGYPEAVSIFLIPPSITELRKRLFNRKTDSAKQKKLRLDMALHEMTYWQKYDYIVLNDDLKTAINEVDMIIAAERAKTNRKCFKRFWMSSQTKLLKL